MGSIHTLEQLKDEYYGLKGTPKRDKLEEEMALLRKKLKLFGL